MRNGHNGVGTENDGLNMIRDNIATFEQYFIDYWCSNHLNNKKQNMIRQIYIRQQKNDYDGIKTVIWKNLLKQFVIC